MQVSLMIEAAPSVNFLISILDNQYSVLITIYGQINVNKNVTTLKRKVFYFYKFHLILICLFVPKMKK